MRTPPQLRYFGLTFLLAVGPCSSGPAHPEPNPRSGFAIEVSVGGDDFVPAMIDAEGDGCERFSGTEDAERTCLITTNTIPTIIGGEAYGELNEKRTPELDALIWRARADGDPAICSAGGLQGAFLVECEQAAVAFDYEYVVDDIRVRVPIGGALPVPSRT